MGDYDATFVVGQAAGLDTTHEKPVEALTLWDAFCSNRDADYVGEKSTQLQRGDGYIYVTGFCGYNGRRDTRDSLLTGFDDGYDFMGYLQARGWLADPNLGDWPYVVYMQRVGDALLYVSYCEADFTLLRFDNSAALQRFRAADWKLRR